MSHGVVSFILYLSPFISVTLILYPALQASWLEEMGNMQGMKFSGLLHLLYLGHAFHKTYIWDPYFLSSSHPSTQNRMIFKNWQWTEHKKQPNQPAEL